MQIPSDPVLKTCILIGSNCVERYKYWSEYKGTQKNECITIVPFDPETGKKDLYSECKLESRKCVKETKKCGDYTGYDPEECAKYYSSNVNKTCVLKGNTCTEDYKTCELYTGSSSYDCENINLKDYTKECKFQSGTGTTESKWVTKPKTCSLYIHEYLGNFCINHSLNDYKRKCVFRGSEYNSDPNTCVEHTNSCDEVTFKSESKLMRKNAMKFPWARVIFAL